MPDGPGMMLDAAAALSTATNARVSRMPGTVIASCAATRTWVTSSRITRTTASAGETAREGVRHLGDLAEIAQQQPADEQDQDDREAAPDQHLAGAGAAPADPGRDLGGGSSSAVLIAGPWVPASARGYPS